jgi:hypothetical protein
MTGSKKNLHKEKMLPRFTEKNERPPSLQAQQIDSSHPDKVLYPMHYHANASIERTVNPGECLSILI